MNAIKWLKFVQTRRQRIGIITCYGGGLDQTRPATAAPVVPDTAAIGSSSLLHQGPTGSASPPKCGWRSSVYLALLSGSKTVVDHAMQCTVGKNPANVRSTLTIK
jgi:hypothetical protein